MKGKYRLFQRAGRIWYVEDRETGKQESLGTADPVDAKRLCDARNQSFSNPALNLALGKTYMSAHDPRLVTRTWGDAMAVWATIGRKPSSLRRKAQAVKMKTFNKIRNKVITKTTADDLLEVIKSGPSANRFMRNLHNLAMDNGWLAWPIIALSSWPALTTKAKRAITRAEHERITKAEPSQEWRDYYELLWEVGCAQTDGATLTAGHIDWKDKTIAYQRHKLGGGSEPAVMTIGPRLEALLRRLPSEGFLFPRLATMTEKSRATHFWKRIDDAEVAGVTLHSYRYSWAERGVTFGYPERWAKAALGHSSSAVHHSYSKKAKVVCPSLEEYEAKVVPFQQSA